MASYCEVDSSRSEDILDSEGFMSGDVKANIFTPFFSTKSKAGTGLGLSLTARAVAVHGGRIEVESVKGRGTQFTINLPWKDENKS